MSGDLVGLGQPDGGAHEHAPEGRLLAEPLRGELEQRPGTADNRFRASGSSAIIRVTHKSRSDVRFWITEGGGIVNFGTDFPCDEHRAAKAVTQTFKVARTFLDSFRKS